MFTKHGGYIISEKAASEVLNAIQKAKGKIGMRRTGGTYVYDIWVKKKRQVNAVSSNVPPPPVPKPGECRRDVTAAKSDWTTVCRERNRCTGRCMQPFTRLGEELV